MNYILVDTEIRNCLLPFTHTRPIADVICGIWSMRERWQQYLDKTCSTLTVEHLQELYPVRIEASNNVLINAAIFANKDLVESINELKEGQKIIYNQSLVAAHIRSNDAININTFSEVLKDYEELHFYSELYILENNWDIFKLNEKIIDADFEKRTYGRQSEPIPSWVTSINPERIFIEKNATLLPCILNASNGPIYIAAGAEIMEGCMVRGALALREHATLKMGAKIYGATTIGAHCKVGGEVNNSVFFAYSNKGHDGFIGNAVIGEWCNLGADTNCSNLKNNYDYIKIWSESQNKFIDTGLQFCGLMMGDHSKAGINTMFNTGTVVGVSCNVYGTPFPDKYIPSFTWGGTDNTEHYDFDKAMDTAARMMMRRNLILTEAHKKMFYTVFKKSKK